MSRKEFKIAAMLDTGDFDKSIESMQKKLRELYAPSDILRQQQQTGQKAAGMGFPGMTAPTSDQFAQATAQSKRAQESSIRDQVAGQERLMKSIVGRQKAMEDLVNKEKQMVQGSKDQLKTLEQIQKKEGELARDREQYTQKNKTLNNSLDLKRVTDGFQNGGMRGAAGAIGGIGKERIAGMGAAGMIGMGAGAVGLLAAGVGAYANLSRDYAQMPINTNVALANVVQGSAGRDVSNVYGRRSAFELPFQGERSRAASQALEAMKAARTSDKLSSGSMIVGGMFAGAGAGAAAGLIGGPLAPLTSTVGAIGGGILGGIGGTAAAMSDPMRRAQLMSNLPFVGQRYGEKYQSMVAEKGIENYNSAYEAEKNLNPYKKAAISNYEQNQGRDLSFQRQMGLNDLGMYGQDYFEGPTGKSRHSGFQGNAVEAGFTPEIAMQMGGNIMSAGGSTRAGVGSSIFGAQLERGMGLTNAGNILGSLSGSMGGSSQTNAATIKILAEGMRLGLDDSKFAEENRRFTQAASEIISRTGSSSESDAGRVAGKFGSMVADNTNAGISAAKSAYDEYQSMSSSTSGARGVMRSAGFLSDPNLSKMSTMDKQALMQIPEDQMSEDSTFVQGLAAKYNMDPKDIIGSVQKVNKGSQNRYKEADQLRDKIQGSLKERGISQLTKESFAGLPKELQADISSLSSYGINENGFKDTQTSQSRAFGQINAGLGGGDAAAREAAIKARAEGKTGNIGDDMVAAAAGDSSTILKNFNDLRPSLQDAAKSAAAFTDKIREMNAELLKALENARKGEGGAADAVKKLFERTANMGQNQTQGARTGK